METKAGCKILLEGSIAEIEEKKSRFIAEIRPVTSEAEAGQFLEEIRKKYWDARHNCSAFVIGERGELTRCSDDGEPAGTAGRPMLEVLLGSEVKNLAVVVTRYFGGTLLGTGGLVRAYSQAVREALAGCRIGIQKKGIHLHLQMDYNDVGKVLYLLGQKGIKPVSDAYGVNVEMELLVAAEDKEALIKELVESTAGRIVVSEGDLEDFVTAL